MSSDERIYRLVFEYYEARILYGYYKYGENLPSISKICAVFRMAPATVRAGLSVLEKQGYIKIDARKASKVIYKSNPEMRRRSAAEYFVPRKKAIQDLLMSSELLFESCRVLELNQSNFGEWERFRPSFEQNTDHTVPVTFQFCLMALRALDNSLILNLYWEVLRFLKFPYLAEDEMRNIRQENFEGKSKSECIVMLTGYFKDCFHKSVKRLFDFIDEAQREFELEQTETFSFQWNIYRQRPQFCYTLVCSVIRDIENGIYTKGSFLPSLPKMAKYYKVSVSTVRRSLSILSSAGLTKSFQGKGTQVLSEAVQVDIGRPEIQDGLRMYQESLQLLKLTIKNVLLRTLGCAPDIQKQKFAKRFSELVKAEKGYLCIEICLTFIEEECPLSGIKECYRKLRELTAWGYPFAVHRLKDKAYYEAFQKIMEHAAGHLGRDEISGFADCLEMLLQQEEKNIREIAVD